MNKKYYNIKNKVEKLKICEKKISEVKKFMFDANTALTPIIEECIKNYQTCKTNFNFRIPNFCSCGLKIH